MASIRARLTTAYAGSLLAAMAVFATVVYVARNTRASRELEEEAAQRADLAVRIVRSAYRSGSTPRDSTDFLGVPTLGDAAQSDARCIPGVSHGARRVGELAVRVTSGCSSSHAVDRRRSAATSRRCAPFSNALVRLRYETGPTFAGSKYDEIVLVSRRDPDPTYRGLYVVAGVSRRSSDSAQRELLGHHAHHHAVRAGGLDRCGARNRPSCRGADRTDHQRSGSDHRRPQLAPTTRRQRR